jgi:hypothetical protein
VSGFEPLVLTNCLLLPMSIANRNVIFVVDSEGIRFVLVAFGFSFG